MKTVLVTGGSGGIGGAIVKEFAAAGYAVAFTYNHNAAAAEKLTGEIPSSVSIQADLSDERAVIAVKEAFFKRFSRLDTLINCAGISRCGLFQDMTGQDFDEVINADLKSAFLVTKAFLPAMIAEKTGSIVNVSSVWGVYGGSCETLYSAAKAGLIGMTKALSREVGRSGVRVNAVAPGFIQTEMNARYTEEEKAEFFDALSLPRAGTPEEVAFAVRALSEMGYVTGEVLGINGGF